MHRLGNLTLLTRSLNSKVSNSAWSTKRSALQDHNTITLTGRVIKRTETEPWNEALIDERTNELSRLFCGSGRFPRGITEKWWTRRPRPVTGVELRHLIEGGMIAADESIVATHRDFKGAKRRSLLTARFSSTASVTHRRPRRGFALRQSATNGWYFWAVRDGRRLRDVRAEFQNSMPADIG